LDNFTVLIDHSWFESLFFGFWKETVSDFFTAQNMIAYCGLICDTCPIHRATLEPDSSNKASMRTEIVTICNEKYGIKISLADITDCDGCRADTGRIFSQCQECEIRKCAKQKDLENCAACNDYPCKILEKFFQDDPDARNRLEMIRRNS
jgi:hypothetical protein